MRARIAVTAALTLVAGFLVASTTGNRPLGGAVLVVGGVLCAWWMARIATWWRILIVLTVAVALFAVSHPLADLVGAWPSVLIVAGVTGVVAWVLAGRRDSGEVEAAQEVVDGV